MVKSTGPSRRIRKKLNSLANPSLIAAFIGVLFGFSLATAALTGSFFVSSDHPVVYYSERLEPDYYEGDPDGLAGNASVEPRSPPPSPTIDDILKECFNGHLTFRHPDEMNIMQSSSLFARASFASSTIDPSKDIPGEGEIRQDSATICRRMYAELTGPGFNIDPKGGTQARIVPDDGYAQWEWSITPKEPGEKQLYITLYTAGPDGRIGDKTYTRSIEVNVPISYTAANFAQKWLSPLGLTVTTIIALTGSALTWWQVKARKRKKKPFYADSWR